MEMHMKRTAVPTHTRTLLGALAACALVAALGITLAPAALASPQYPAPSVSPLLAAETEALTRQGISTARATQAIQVQSELAQTDLIRKIEAALGSAYAGVWFEPTTAQLHVGVISPAARHTAEATAADARLSSQVVETPVASTWAQLLSTENHWSARLARLSDPVKLALAPQLNAVIVTLSSTLPTTQLTALGHEATASTVTVRITVEPPQQIEPTPDRTGQCKAFVTKAAFCEKPIASGVSTTSLFGGTCTSGPLAIGKGIESNKTYVLTAGHCIVVVGEPELFFADTPAGAGGVIGPSAAAVVGNGRNGDYGSVKVAQPGFWAEPSNPPVFALTAEWKLTGGSTISYPVKGERTPAVGLTNCHEGQTTGQSCGQIKALNLIIEYGNGLKVAGLVEDKGANGDAGDSGGPWLFIESNNEVRMEGIHVASFRGNGIKAFYTPLQTALNALKLELLTTKNEVRKLPGPVWRQRPTGTTGNGVEIPQSAPEKFLSKGGTSVLTTPPLGITITCLEVQNKGTIWNNKLQGQGKLQVELHKCTVTGNGAGCTVAEPIKFSTYFHLAWKWNGEAKQLEQGNQEALGQKVDILFTPKEIQEGAESISETENFVTLNFTGTCTVASTEVVGFESAQIYPTQVGTWTSNATFVFTPARHLQHFWNGTKQVGVETRLRAFGLVETGFESVDEANTFQAANGEPVEVSIAEN
jgi:streptogrisin C